MNFRKLLTLAVSAAMLLSACLIPASAADGDIKVTVDGKEVAFTDAKPFVDENNRTMLPLRAVGDALGLTVNWNQKAKVAETPAA